ncbi:MAG: sigma-70 family RNA polymerase sigma factor [Bacteroidota bacterium]
MPAKPKSYSADFKSIEGFQRIYRKYNQKMFGIGYWKIKNVDVTRTIVQDIFLSLWERREDIELNGPIENYLMGCLKFKIIDYYREAEAHNVIQISKEMELVAYNTTEQELEYEELQERLNIHLKELPSKTQKIFSLSKVNGFTNSKIAKKLATSERTVYAHLTNAVSHLKKQLKGDYKITFWFFFFYCFL